MTKRLDPDADAEALARAMADVVPLEPDPRHRVRPARPISPPAVGRPRTEGQPAGRSVHAEPLDTDDDGAQASSFAANGVDRRELRKLKRGDYPAGDRLDLHRLTATEAVARVARFIDQSRSRHRCVCIVHGRGLHSEGNVAVLKSRVRETLRIHPAVLAYADAPANDGGGGAVYLLLRK